ncbi:MAG: GTP cyclohydrolase II [Motiliproteus sp.]|jgi:GTP cyclohydrolase II
MFQPACTALFSKSVTVPMPTASGEFRMTVYTERANGREHLVLQMGDADRQESPVVRLHSECATGDLFGSKRCDCGAQLQHALEYIGREGDGVLVYLRQEGRGIGLSNKLRAYQLQDQGLDTVDANLKMGFQADERCYELAAEILKSMGIDRLRLLTNNPDKVAALAAFSIRVEQRIPIEVGYAEENAGYLAAKKLRMGHFLTLNE